MTAAMSFWERRRAAVKAEEEAELRAAQEAVRAQDLKGKTDAEVLAEMGLPDPETMAQGDDFAAFMSRDVPERLRTQALRTLWRSNPVLACVDGLNDYDDDYRASMSLKEPVKTAYQVGKGMRVHLDKMQRKAEALAESERDDPIVAREPQKSYEEQRNTVAPEPAESEVRHQTAALEPDSDTRQDTPTPRRMRFCFEEDRA